jgi:branched-chain amino acid transport system substrate-binding protein
MIFHQTHETLENAHGRRSRSLLKLIVFVCLAAGLTIDAQTRTIRIAGFGALTGPVKSFGINSRAAQRAAVDEINRGGGLRLADGSKARLELTYDDDRCDPDEALRLVKQFAASNALVAIGPSCSSVAEPLYAALQHRAGDDADAGIQMPILTDGATKANLARLSDWAFRNVADETAMYRTLWTWVHQQHPDLKTVFGGEEGDFAHSHSTWKNIISKTAIEAGFTVVGEAAWSIEDSQFGGAVARMHDTPTDIVVLSAHATTTCGVLTEMAKQRVRPKLVVGLTSSATQETLQRCGALANGLLIPTTFAETTAAARHAAIAVKSHGGVADLHSMAAWENVMIIKDAIERAGISGRSDTVAADRGVLRAALATLRRFEGLLGTVVRTADRESRKPFALVEAHQSGWTIVGGPVQPAIADQHSSDPTSDSREEQVRIPGPRAEERLFLRHLPPVAAVNGRPRGSVLFVHGATFPSALAAAYEFDSESWMDSLSRAGFDAWALDFVGYGGSSRYPEMNQPADAHRPLGTAPECAEQVAAAVRLIRQRQHVERVSIIAHSWGTIAAGIYATRHPDEIQRFVMFGPIAIRHQSVSSAPPAWWRVTSDYQWERFQREVPTGESPVFSREVFDRWIAAYLATDPASKEQRPPAVKVPSGPIADIDRAWSGTLPYDPADITVPTLLVRGAWDTVCSAADLAWLKHRLSRAPVASAVTLPRGTHVMHLEKGRRQLYAAVQRFLAIPETRSAGSSVGTTLGPSRRDEPGNP